MKIHAIKALWRSTSTTLLIRARSAQDALTKAEKMKENEGALEFQFLGTREDANPQGLERVYPK